MLLDEIIADLTEKLQTRVLILFGYAASRVALEPLDVAAGDVATTICIDLARALGRDPSACAQAVANGFSRPILVQPLEAEPSGRLVVRFDRGAFTVELLRTLEPGDRSWLGGVLPRLAGSTLERLRVAVARAEEVARELQAHDLDPQLDESELDRLTLEEGLRDPMWSLIRRSAELPAIVRRVNAPIDRELTELADQLVHFIDESPIATESNRDERQRRMVTVEVARRTLAAVLAETAADS